MTQSSKRTGSATKSRLFVVLNGDRFSQIGERIQARVIAAGDRDLAEMIEGGAIFVHVAAHHHGNLAVGPHGAVRNFPVAHVAGLNAAAPMLGERRRRADNERKIDDT